MTATYHLENIGRDISLLTSWNIGRWWSLCFFFGAISAIRPWREDGGYDVILKVCEALGSRHSATDKVLMLGLMESNGMFDWMFFMIRRWGIIVWYSMYIYNIIWTIRVIYLPVSSNVTCWEIAEPNGGVNMLASRIIELNVELVELSSHVLLSKSAVVSAGSQYKLRQWSQRGTVGDVC